MSKFKPRKKQIAPDINNRCKECNTEEDKEFITCENIENKKHIGNEKDLINHMQRYYKEKGWQQYAKFNKQGGFSIPYILFKMKNIKDQETRKEKWYKVRPIVPQIKHPMKTLYHMSGRAWSFITKQLPGKHFILNKTTEVPKLLDTANEKLGKHGDIEIQITDIVGCFPNMPVESIKKGMSYYINQLEREYKGGVYVPSKQTKQCTWKVSYKTKGYTFMSFKVLRDI